MTTRREFLQHGGAALGVSVLAGSATAGIPRLLSAAPAPNAAALEAFQDPAAV